MHFSQKAAIAITAVSAALLFAYSVFLHSQNRPRFSLSQDSTQVILYYQDPMHPEFRSDKPGRAPDCGMELEPVYKNGNPNATASPLDPHLVRTSDAAASLIGLKTVLVGEGDLPEDVTITGVVQPDESRVFKVVALADGVVRYVAPIAEGSTVERDQRLATYFVYTRDLYNAVQAYVLGSNSYDQVASTVHDASIVKVSKSQKRVGEELLRAYGLTADQIRELSRTREVTRDIDFRSPISGVVLDRSVSPGEQVNRGNPLFRIAGLHHVWILADVSEQNLSSFRAGSPANVFYGGRKFSAVVTSGRILDAVTRRMKVRLELENPDLILRPDMVVKLQVAGHDRTTLSIPADCVVRTGTKNIVFVPSDDGSYVARAIALGRIANGRVEVKAGLRRGERVVSQGAFLLAAEEQVQLSTAADFPTPAETVLQDPVCGMKLGHSTQESENFDGNLYFFCSKRCHTQCNRTPASYAEHTAQSSLGDEQ